jgi:hypothetical protein
MVLDPLRPAAHFRVGAKKLSRDGTHDRDYYGNAFSCLER